MVIKEILKGKFPIHLKKTVMDTYTTLFHIQLPNMDL